jgi:AmpE protein
MTLIAIVIALGVELFADQSQSVRSLQWLQSYRRWLQARLGSHRFWQGPLGVIGVMILPLVLVAVVQTGLREVWLGVFALAFATVMLLYCLRYRPLDRAVQDYCDAAESDDPEAAGQAASRVGVTDDARSGVRAMTEAVLVQSGERLFAVLFWFVLLGPLGAILYRMAWSLAEPVDSDEDSEHEAGFTEAAQRLHGILLWVPARLVAFGYALAGNFEDAIHDWRDHSAEASGDWVDDSAEVLRLSGLGALRLGRYEVPVEDVEQEDEEAALEPATVESARGLVLRVLVIWVAAIALISLAGWAH